MHYLQVRARDAADNISIGNAQQVVNYEPSTDQVGRGQTRVYRYTVEAGQAFTADLRVLSGDADLYVWSSDEAQSARVSNQFEGDEQVIVPANEIVPGIYQVEVYGYTAASYQLTAGAGTTLLAASDVAQAEKPPREEDGPIIPVDSVPDEQQGTVPTSGTDVTSSDTLYLPLIQR
jgi:hypothetical protein